MGAPVRIFPDYVRRLLNRNGRCKRRSPHPALPRGRAISGKTTGSRRCLVYFMFLPQGRVYGYDAPGVHRREAERGLRVVEYTRNMLILVEVASFAVDQDRNAPLVILKERGGERTLPVSIGPFEASAIAIKSLNVKPDKPLTIDLAKAIMEQLNGKLDRVVIHDFVDNSYATRLHVVGAGGVHLLECRASDAIALALRCDAAIFVAERVFEKSDMGAPSRKTSLRTTIRSIDTLDFGRYYLE